MKTVCSRHALWLTVAFAIISQVPVSSKGFAQETEIADAAYKDACGPFASLIALRLLGVESSLDELGQRCGWVEGNPVSFGEMQRVLSSYTGIECSSVRLTPDQLLSTVSDANSVIILAVRKDSQDINHAVCLESYDASQGLITWIDYPEFHQQKTIEEIVEVWDGTCLLVTTGKAGILFEKFLFVFVPFALLAFVGTFLFKYFYKVSKVPSV